MTWAYTAQKKNGIILTRYLTKSLNRSSSLKPINGLEICALSLRKVSICKGRMCRVLASDDGISV